MFKAIKRRWAKLSDRTRRVLIINSPLLIGVIIGIRLALLWHPGNANYTATRFDTFMLGPFLGLFAMLIAGTFAGLTMLIRSSKTDRKDRALTTYGNIVIIFGGIALCYMI